MNSSNLKVNPSYEEVLSKNRYGVRMMEANYLKHEYDTLQRSKNIQKVIQQVQKQKQYQNINKLSELSWSEIEKNRKRRLQEMQSLSMQYDNHIKTLQEKKKMEKIIQRNIEKSTLQSQTWIRDVFSQRNTNKKNRQNYSKALDEHVKLQEERKKSEKQHEQYLKRKINQQAQIILKKQYQQLQARHRQKSLFEKRQNQILGVQHEQSQSFNTLQPKQAVYKRKQQDLYGQGLSIQYQKQLQKRQAQQKIKLNNSFAYNPITNPIPYSYKNPNVLRMLAQI